VRLKATELNRLQKLGVDVIRSDPRQRGFLQPCPLWNGQCTIYDSPEYPHGCGSYNCKLLRELLDESVSLPKALRVVKRAKERIHEVDPLLSAATIPSFRERLVNYLEGADETQDVKSELHQKAHALVDLFRADFGVNDLLESKDKS
jgi:hypothetical protein